MLYAVLITLLICLVASVSSSPRRERGAEMRLFQQLMRSYDTGARPVINANHTVNVNFSISLNKIHDLVEKDQTLITHVWVLQEWVDERLVWEPARFRGLAQAVVPSSRIWLPDIYIFNNADKGSYGYVTSADTRLLVHSDGRIEWAIPVIIKSSCAVDIRYFPFDNQHCFVRFGSWIYEVRQLDLVLKDTEVDLSPPFSVNSELHLRAATLAREMMHYDILPGHYPQITMYLSIRRKPVYYAYTVIAPTLVLCILTLFTFLLPCDNGDKVGIGLTVFLSLYVLQLGIAENIPESNSLPLIGLFLTLVMTLNAISLVFATLVINIKKKGDRQNCRAVPTIVLTLCRRFLSVLTCTPFSNFYEFYGVCDPDIINALGPKYLKPRDQMDTKYSASENANLGNKLTPKVSYVTSGGQTSVGMASLRPKGTPNHDKSQKNGNKDVHKDASVRESSAAYFAPPRDPTYEWYFVAEVLDKTLLFIFLIGMVLTVVVSLVVVPFLHRND